MMLLDELNNIDIGDWVSGWELNESTQEFFAVCQALNAEYNIYLMKLRYTPIKILGSLFKISGMVNLHLDIQEMIPNLLPMNTTYLNNLQKRLSLSALLLMEAAYLHMLHV